MNGGRDVGDGLAYHRLVGYNDGDDDEDEEEEGDADDKVVGGGQMWATVWRIITFRKFSAHSHLALLSWSFSAVDQYSLVNKCSATFTHPSITTSLPKLVANDTHDDDEM